MRYNLQQLMALWISAGGAIGAAAMAAAVAMAESSGISDNVSLTGDVGLWQISPIWHPTLVTFDPIGNAQAAIQISRNGQSWRDWCTCWSDNACGKRGGSYLGPGSAVLKYLGGGAPAPAPPEPAPDPYRGAGDFSNLISNPSVFISSNVNRYVLWFALLAAAYLLLWRD